jgi:hypothetical protein
MSRIDTPRVSANGPISVQGERVAPGRVPVDGRLLPAAPAAPRSRPDYRFGVEPQHRAEPESALSPHAIRPEDLLPLAQRGSDQIMADISRLLARLHGALEREQDADQRQSLEVGQAALEDDLRRMHILNAGYSALVMKW